MLAFSLLQKYKIVCAIISMYNSSFLVYFVQKSLFIFFLMDSLWISVFGGRAGDAPSWNKISEVNENTQTNSWNNLIRY